MQALVNNAGFPARAAFPEVELDLVEEVARVNYLGGVWMTRALLPALRPGRGATRSHIVNVVSVAGTVAFAPSGAYTAAKHAQLAFSRSLQVSLRGTGIDVHTILPGYVETEGFPQTSLARASGAASYRRAARAGGASDRPSDRARPPRGRRAVVPVPTCGPALRRRSGHRVEARSARHRTEQSLQGEGGDRPVGVVAGWPSSRGRRPGSVRQRRGCSVARDGTACSSPAARTCFDASRRRSAARSRSATWPIRAPWRRQARGSSNGIQRSTCSYRAPASSSAAPSSMPRSRTSSER